MNEKLIVVILIVLALVGGGIYLNKDLLFSNSNQGIKNVNSNTGTPIIKDVIVNYWSSKENGAYLTDEKGMTLYTSTADTRLKSNCDSECAKTWIPYTNTGKKTLRSYQDRLSKKINIILRSDGTSQYAYTIWPLYYYIGDKKPGETNGKSLENGKWNIVKNVDK